MTNEEKFKKLLTELFQFETSDLDFGIYKIINYKREKIRNYIFTNLPQKVDQAFSKFIEQINKDIDKRVAELQNKIITNIGNDAFEEDGSLKKIYYDIKICKEYLNSLKQKQNLQEINEIKSSVYNDLYNFFSRFYEDGDFIPRFRYSIKGHKYSIPYNGEEIKLYWVNADQYYIKTGYLFRDYTFRVNDHLVIFRTVEAKEEVGSNKSTKERFFILMVDPFELIDKQFIIRFQYRELTGNEIKKFNISGGSNYSKQLKINEYLSKEIEKYLKNEKQNLLLEKLLNYYNNDKNFLLYHLNKFTAKNTKDYFIHKNLKKFLSNQLDYYIKTEVLNLDLIQDSDAFSKHIAKAKVIREIGEDIIEFLSQIEDFQKRLWEKKKFILTTNYVITLDKIKEFADSDFLNSILEDIKKNNKQINEWKELGLIDKNLKFTKNENLFDKEYTNLPIDTRHFSNEFKEKLIEALTKNNNLDDILDGLLIKSENWQALNLFLNKYKEKVQTIYIDPPFNKEQDADYLYNVKYKDSTWISLLENRLILARDLLNDRGSIFVRCDYNGNMYVRLLMNEIFGEENFRNEISIKRTEGKSRIEGLSFSISTESLFFYAKSDKQFFTIPFKKTDFYKNMGLLLERLKKLRQNAWLKIVQEMFNEIFWIDLDHRPGERSTSSIINVFGKEFRAPSGRHWLYSQKRIEEAINKNKVRLICNKCNTPLYNSIDKCQNCGSKDFKVQIFYDEESLTTNWTDEQSYSQSNFWGIKFPTENSEILLKRVIESTSNEGDLVMDFFLGSGTTTAVAHKLKRKWIGIEMGEHFWTVILPRMKKVLAYDKSGISKEKDVKEKYNEKTAGGFFKYHTLEQYEDTLDNIELKENKKQKELFGEEEYLLKYFISAETNGSPYLLNIEKLRNPFNYKLKVNFSEVGEPEEILIDIPETFNYLLGIKVNKIKFRINKSNKYLFILGEKGGKNYVIIWREVFDNWGENDFEEDKQLINKEILDWSPQIVYVNTQSVLDNLRYELKYIDPDFKRMIVK